MPDRDFLYKYRAIDPENPNFTKRIFTHRELYFSHVDQFNDPFDCRYKFDFTASDKELKRYFSGTLQHSKPTMSRAERRKWFAEKVSKRNLTSKAFKDGLARAHKELLNSIGVCCLTEVPDDILMWSHYANSHRGFCLKFRDDPNEYFIARAQPITYSDDYPVVNPVLESDEVRMEKSFLTKAKHWAYEKEWRIIAYEQKAGVQKFPSKLLEAVIFGCRTTEEDRTKIIDWSKEGKFDLNFYQAREKVDKYSLFIESI